MQLRAKEQGRKAPWVRPPPLPPSFIYAIAYNLLWIYVFAYHWAVAER